MIHRRFRTARPQHGFTLVELLVVIAIIGILVAMLLPAVQAAREAGRRSQCVNHLKQIALGFLMHEEVHGHLPTGGWGFNWVGDPDRGFGREQPGTWTYSILPFMEQQALHDQGADGQPDVVTQQQKDGASTVLAAPMSFFFCPSRRQTMLYPGHVTFHSIPNYAHVNANSVEPMAAGDYAANAGHRWSDFSPTWMAPGPPGAFSYNWGQTVDFGGICFKRSEVTLSDVKDGTTNTYLVGEKFLGTDFYVQPHHANHHGLYSWDHSNVRYGSADKPPMRDKELIDPYHADGYYRFGGAHSATWNVALCDGSVRSIGYAIDGATHERLSNRSDGETIDASQL